MAAAASDSPAAGSPDAAGKAPVRDADAFLSGAASSLPPALAAVEGTGEPGMTTVALIGAVPRQGVATRTRRVATAGATGDSVPS